MANPFQRYQSGGFEAVPGIAQAGANIGQMLGSGFSNFGGSIGAGIKQYYENKAKSTAAMQEIEVLGPQLLARRNAYLEASGIDPATLDRYMQDDPSEGTDDEMFKTISANPMVQLAKTLDPAIEALKKAPTKGLSAQLAALNSGKAAIGMVDEQIKLQDFVAKYRFEQTLNDLPDSVSVEQDVVTPAAQFDPNDPLFTNVNKVRSDLKAAGFSDDKVEQGVRKYLEQSGAKIRADETLGTPEQRESLIDALTRYSEGKLDTEGNLTDYGQEDAYVEGILSKIQKEKEAAEKAAVTPSKEATSIDILAESAASNINAKREAEAASKKQGASAKEQVRQAVVNIVGTGKIPNVSNFVQEKGKILEGMGIKWDGDKYVDKDGKNVDWLDSAMNKEYEMLLDSMGMSSLKGLTNPAREKAMVEELRSNPEFQTRVLGAIPASKARAEKLAAEGQKLADTKPTTAADVLATSEPKKPEQRSKTFSVGELELGTEIVERRLNAVEKETAAREFYAKRFGSVPPGFTQMYRQMFPEATVRTTEVNGIPVMVDGKGNVTALTSNKEVDVEKQAAAKALTFDNTEIADGVRLSGVFAGTVTGAQTFRKDYAHMANVRGAVDELIKINDMGWESLSPTARERAKQLQSTIIAAMRIPIIGPGQVAIYEQEILQDIVKRGTGMFTLESSERAALRGLKDRLDKELVNWPKSMGLDVKIGGQTSETIKRLRMQKLRSARNLKPIGEAQ